MSLRSLKYDPKNKEFVLRITADNGVELSGLPASSTGKTLIVGGSGGAVQTTIEAASALGTVKANVTVFAPMPTKK